ncbi:MAG: cobyric acid synthase [Pseudomonadota bacterium]
MNVERATANAVKAKSLMLQGAGSDVGKSLITAALCRSAKRRGIKVAPFKPQNMSNNAAACPPCNGKGGGEIGRAQALQALAAGLAPNTDMNPVLLKPQTDRTAQVVVQGRAIEAMEAADYMAKRDRLMGAVLESFDRLTSNHDLVLIEGAGSPAEINLRNRDIANMGFARRAGVPVCLIGDIERGGVIASLVGTKNVLAPEDAAMIGGFLVNKFRGDPRLFDDGVVAIEERTGWPCFGVIPWLSAASRLPAEDAVVLDKSPRAEEKGLKIVAPVLSRIANFDDADPLKLEPSVDFIWVAPGRPIPRDADVIILFGTKSTLGDLEFLRAQGWDHDIIAHARAGGHVLGLCGGYQMLGRTIADPHGLDGAPSAVKGLDLLAVDTVIQSEKRVATVAATCALTAASIAGYEIHIGRTDGPDRERPFAKVGEVNEGARNADGRIEGSYLHGLFSSDAFRRAWLERAGGGGAADLCYGDALEDALNALADGVEAAMDVDALFDLAREPGWTP